MAGYFDRSWGEIANDPFNMGGPTIVHRDTPYGSLRKTEDWASAQQVVPHLSSPERNIANQARAEAMSSKYIIPNRSTAANSTGFKPLPAPVASTTRNNINQYNANNSGDVIGGYNFDTNTAIQPAPTSLDFNTNTGGYFTGSFGNDPSVTGIDTTNTFQTVDPEQGFDWDNSNLNPGNWNWGNISSGINAGTGIAQTYLGFQQLGLAEDQYNFQRNAWQQDYNMRLQDYNRRIERQDGRDEALSR